MKIDLHCHTKRIKSGDGAGRNVTPELFYEKVVDADVKIVAITNHNAFDYDQFLILQEKVKDFCAVWPGVEIDIQGSNGKKFHLIIVANPENAKTFSDGVSLLFKGLNLESCQLTLERVYECLNKYDVIYIPHYHKTPSISEEDRATLYEIVGERWRVFCEPSDHRALGVFANHDYNVLIGSDVKDWSKYEESTFAELRLPVDGFAQFCLLAKRDPVIVNTLRNKKQTFKLTASPHERVKFPLQIYADVNIIFGQKGTGKSEILKSLYQDMVGRGVSCVKYTGTEKDTDFSGLLKTNDMEEDCAKLGANSCEEYFRSLFEWTDTAPTLFSNYSNWWDTKDNNANKRRMKITESADLGEPEILGFNDHAKDYTLIQSIFDEIKKVDIELYLSKKDKEDLCQLLTRLKHSVYAKREADIIEKYVNQLVNFSIEKIKLFADRNSDTISKPSSCGFRDFCANRLKLRRSIEAILTNLETKERNEREYLGELEGKGKIYINRRYRFLCENSKTGEFGARITVLRDLVYLLNKMKQQIYDADLMGILSNFTQKCSEEQVTSLKAFLGISKQIVLESGDTYKPSNGEKGILLLQKALGENADAYFLDEPELGMGNSYIDTNIRPLISSLAKQQKVVVVATHNANIAVRTLPYTSVFRIHENGKYSTYVGNPFNDLLVNIEDDTDIRSWVAESMHTLEGGKDAFYERRDIYESKRN